MRDTKVRASEPSDQVVAEVTRHHVDVQGRRVHYRRMGSGPPVLLLHASPRSGAAMLPLMAMAPPGITVLAPDTPGNGLSQPLHWTRPSADDHADALADLLTALGINRCAVLGRHSGAAFGSALAARHPQRVSRLVLDGVSAFTPAERAGLLAGYLPPFEPLADGTHMAWLWHRMRDQALFFPWHHCGSGARLAQPLPSPQALHHAAMDLLMAGDAYRAPYRAAFAFDPAAVLPRLTMPVEVGARASDVLQSHLARLPPLPPHVCIRHLPDDPVAVGALLWRWLGEGAQGLAPAPPPSDAALPVDGLGDTLVGEPGRRIHLRGATGAGVGTGRPLVWLHASPGGARGLDRRLERERSCRPVMAPDLPGHGESDAFASTPEAVLDALRALLLDQGWADAELGGDGLGGLVAAALAQQLPASRCIGPAATHGEPPAGFSPGGEAPSQPAGFAPRADGGHLMAAWLHARDDAILGGWWSRRATDGIDFGDAPDLVSIHAQAVEALKERPDAAALRAAWADRASASTSAPRAATTAAGLARLRSGAIHA